MGLIEDIKGIAREGADLSGIEGQIAGLNPLTGLQTKEAAFELIKGTPLMISAFDSAVSKSVEAGVENFKEKGMKDVLKERETALRLELNPKEDKADKVAREFEEYKTGVEADKAKSTLRDELSAKAKELGFDPIRARDFAIFEGDAMAKMEDYASWQTETLNTRLSTELKDKYNLKTPGTNQQTPGKSVKRADYDAMSPNQQREIALDASTAIID